MAGELSQCVLTLSAAVVLRKNKIIEEGGITIDFPNMYDMLKSEVDPLAEKTYFVKKKLKTACLGGKVSGLPDFGRTCMPNYWHYVNF